MADPFKDAIEDLLEELGRRGEGLLHHLDDARQSQRMVADELKELGARFDLLANLYVQLQQLHASLHLPDVVRALNDVLMNLVGSEDFALLVRDAATGRFEPLWAVGAGARIGAFALGEGRLGAAAADGQIRYREVPDDPVAAVPLRSTLRDGCLGVLAVCGLLGHKKALSERDRRMLETFGAHAAVALEGALAAAAAGTQTLPVERMRALLGELAVPTLALDVDARTGS